jgi:hypothetical protein
MRVSEGEVINIHTIEGLRLAYYALLLGTETSWDMSVFFDKSYGNIINLHRMWFTINSECYDLPLQIMVLQPRFQNI